MSVKWSRSGHDLFVEDASEHDGLRHPTGEELDALVACWEVVKDCPLGVYDGKVIASRTMTEEIMAAWVLRLYEAKKTR